MARPFKYTLDRRIVNRIIVWLLKSGRAPSSYYLLTVNGRISGKPHSVPVVLVEEGDKRWLVAPYGEADWVKNARASGRLKLSRGTRSEDWGFHELSPEGAAPVLKKYLQQNTITKPYFDARADSALDEFVRDARSRPVFELIRVTGKKNRFY